MSDDGLGSSAARRLGKAGSLSRAPASVYLGDSKTMPIFIGGLPFGYEATQLQALVEKYSKVLQAKARLCLQQAGW